MAGEKSWLVLHQNWNGYSPTVLLLRIRIIQTISMATSFSACIRWSVPANDRRIGAPAESARSGQSMDLGPGFAQALSRLPQEAATHVASVSRRVLCARSRPGHRLRHF